MDEDPSGTCSLRAMLGKLPRRRTLVADCLNDLPDGVDHQPGLLKLNVVAAVRLCDVPGVRDELRIVVLPFFPRLVDGRSKVCRDPRWQLSGSDQRLQGLLDGMV